MKFKIPETIKIINHHWEISNDQMVLDAVDAVGIIVPNNKIIYIDDTAPNMSEIFIHEVTHSILDALGKEELNEDEEFVKPFAKCLHQVIQQLEEEI